MVLRVCRCESCGAKLEVSNSGDIVKCSYCGTEYLKEGFSVFSGSAENFLQLAKNEFDYENYEKACYYFEKVLENNPKNYYAIFMRGCSLGNQFCINDFRFKDFLVGYYEAGKYMP
ncbi:MAG: hypothetical protein PHV39_07530, partial [Methanomicrobium sp.]|nr:hypothetical protein [Methanomicrobium sp.]